MKIRRIVVIFVTTSNRKYNMINIDIKRQWLRFLNPHQKALAMELCILHILPLKQRLNRLFRNVIYNKEQDIK